MSTVAIIQARMGSSRLPGKVLRALAGRPMLDHVFERTSAICGVDHVVVATSTNAADDAIANWGKSTSRPIFRGSEDDVLGRYVAVIEKLGCDVVVRITADCPLLDPNVCARVLQEFEASDPSVDYAVTAGYPRGLDTEVIRAQALLDTHQETSNSAEREHVTLRLYRRPQDHRIMEVRKGGVDLSEWRWTVDTPSDMRFVEAILQRLNPSDFRWESVYGILESEPDLALINSHIPQKSPD